MPFKINPFTGGLSPVVEDLAESNTSEFSILYIKGDEDTDGSIRLIIDIISGVTAVEERSGGVWNLGEFQFAQGSILIGRDTKISVSGHHLVLNSPDFGRNHIIVAQDLQAESTGPPQATILGPFSIRQISQPDNSTSLTLANHASSVTATGFLLVTAVYLQVGAIGASDDVSVSFSIGIPTNDTIFFQKNYPASDFPANSEVRVDLSPGVEFDPGFQVNGFIDSPNAFTMRYNISSTVLWFAVDLQQLDHEDILVETLLLGNDLGSLNNSARPKLLPM